MSVLFLDDELNEDSNLMVIDELNDEGDVILAVNNAWMGSGCITLQREQATQLGTFLLKWQEDSR